jgi:hypothetical protein
MWCDAPLLAPTITPIPLTPTPNHSSLMCLFSGDDINSKLGRIALHT